MSETRRVPKDKRAIIAVDLGAESCRVSLLQWTNDSLTWRLIYRFPNAPRMVDGGLRWDLKTIESGIQHGLHECALYAPEGVRSIAVDGWAVDYVRLDQWGVAASDPYCYRDERTVAAEESLHQRISPDRIRALTGVQLMRLNTLYQLHSDAIAGVGSMYWLNLPEYILYRLGGAAVAEITNATHCQLVDSGHLGWCTELFEAAGSDLACAPRIVPAGTIVGRLTGPISKVSQLSDTSLIAPACHDTASAIAGIPADGDDWAYISSGTWSLVGTVMDKPVNSDLAAAENFTNLAGAGGTVCFHKNINGMWILRECLAYWELRGMRWSLTELLVAAERVTPPVGLIDVDDPQLIMTGDMLGRINRQRNAKGLPSLDDSPQNAPAVVCLILHSLANRYAVVLDRVAMLTGKRLQRLFIVGGGSQNVFLSRLTEEATGLKVIRGSSESSTIGNFAVQLAALENNDTASGKVRWNDVAAWASRLQN